jgi:carboxymethylenebutenolidase
MYFWGGRDAHIGPEAVQAVTTTLDAGKKDYVNVVFSTADHGFFCDARASYNATSAAQAWPLTLAFFNSHLMGAAKKADA